VWVFDEHRLGLQPILRKVWAKRGRRPIVPVQPRYEWLYLYGFVCPQSGQNYWLLLPKVNYLVFNLALAQWAKGIGASPTRRKVLILDGASWHRGRKVEIPEGVHLIFLPPYSPELQPAERLWPLSNEGIANRKFDSLAELEAVQSQWCLELAKRPAQVAALTSYSWWPKVAA
jgi:hypothetical protein